MTKTAAPKPWTSGFCNPHSPRTSLYDPHQHCRGCDCRADNCPCNPEDPMPKPLTPSEAWGTTTQPEAWGTTTQGVTDLASVIRALAIDLTETGTAGISELDWTEAVRCLDILRDATTAINDTVGALTRHIYLHGEHGETDVEGVGRIRITRGRERKSWDGHGVAQAVIDAHMEDSDGEVPAPWDVAGWLLEAVAVSYGRVTVLRGLGIEPDEFCASSPGLPKVTLPPRRNPRSPLAPGG